MNYLKVLSPITVFAICSAFSSTVLATTAPKIGGVASISVTVNQGGIVNAGGGAGTAGAIAKQAIGSVLSGTIDGGLTDTVTVLKGGILNVGGAVGMGQATACQSVGTVGSDCN